MVSLKSQAPETIESGKHVATLDPGADTNSQSTAKQIQQRVTTSQTNPGIFSGHKLNLVIQGILECSSDMKRLERLQSDLTSVLTNHT